MTDHARALAALVERLRRLDRSPRTVATVLPIARRFLSSLGRRAAARATPEDVRRYLARRSGALAATTQQGELFAVRGLFRALVEAGLARADPTAGLSVRRAWPRPRLLLGEEAVAALLRAASPAPGARGHARALALRDRALLEVLYGLGLRAAEARAARVADLDLREGALLVRRAKRGEPATLPLPPRAAAALGLYVREGRPRLARREGRDQGFLFLSRGGRPLREPSALNKILARVARAAGVAFHPHALRRALATHLVRAGVSVPLVQRLLGHARLTSTACYVGVADDELRHAVAALEASL